MKRILTSLLAAVFLAAGGFFLLAPRIAADRMNRVARPAHPPKVGEDTARFIREHGIADLHADSLLWGRDLLALSGSGHLDLPRMLQGGFRLQIFDAVTKTPRHLNIERNDGATDDITLLAWAQRWPMRTHDSLLERALFAADRLRDLVSRSQGRMHLVRWREDVPVEGIGALLGIEGAHALDGRVANVEALFDADYRVVGLAHFFDNEFAGSAHGVEKGGLTPDGIALIERLEKKEIIVDLAHASARTIGDVLDRAQRPVMVSHTGVRATCDNNRNLGDDQLRRIAAAGGIVGIGFWPQAVCGGDPAAIARAVQHAVRVAGVEHVAFGSDFDGAVTVPFDAAGIGELVQALFDAGLDRQQVAAIMVGNAERFLARNLPARPAPSR